MVHPKADLQVRQSFGNAQPFEIFGVAIQHPSEIPEAFAGKGDLSTTRI
jgi:hypothetical protein